MAKHSTQEVPATGPLYASHNTTRSPTQAPLGPEEGQERKRRRLEAVGPGPQQQQQQQHQQQQQQQTPTHTPSTQACARTGGPVDSNRTRDCDSTSQNPYRHPSDPDCAPVIHLRGDPNSLKCFRYRLQNGKKGLYCKASSTWRWSCEPENQSAFVTIWYTSVTQRAEFLANVKIPPGMQAILGHMSVF
uniref:Protein E8^E2C n=1 Tax=Human papillomavirus 29 TaxID=37112 RepID=VE8E2_HPV29|nr:RecName: Full=Protein E8^E2C [Human papillomavirus 29]